MKFDVVVGNPPYQESNEDTRDDAIYNYFYDLAEKIAPEYALISPARFLFNAGSTDEKWNKKMLSDEHLKVLFYERNSSKIFKNTDIKGGITIIYRNQNKNFGKIGMFTPHPELSPIINKVFSNPIDTIDEIISGQGIYKFTDKMHADHPEVKGILSKSHPNDVGTGVLNTLDNIVFFENKPEDGNEYIKIFGRYKNNRVSHWIRKDYINEPLGYDKYRVVIPKAVGNGYLGESLANPVILDPYCGFTQTFIYIGMFNHKTESENVLKYIKTKFARIMLGVLKITQDGPRNKWKYVPLQNFTNDSDIDWNNSIDEIDEQLFKKYKLSSDDIHFIKSTAKKMI
ncbi:hypothetical protein AP1H75_02920 [Apilactobacillus apinorum]|uniref:Eco57I restriction-modification methylase domain-containing protein n=1 Tax=Apilactobacillus apinorum TaxID=1218495 RepID=UPI0030E7D509